jgi:hypothetical protein
MSAAKRIAIAISCLVFGVLLFECLICSGILIIQPSEDADIAARYAQFQSAIADYKYEIAYQYMSPAYRLGHTIEQFKQERGYAADDSLGLTALHPNHCLRVNGEQAILYPRDCSGFLTFWTGYAYELVRVNGEWYFSGNYEWYTD